MKFSIGVIGATGYIGTAYRREIREAVEQQFSVSVEAIQVINVRGKMKRFGRTPGKQKNWKKAYVRLAQGHDIDFLGSGA